MFLIIFIPGRFHILEKKTTNLIRKQSVLDVSGGSFGFVCFFVLFCFGIFFAPGIRK